MRTILCIFFVLLTLKSFGQVKEASQVEPWFFLDSIRISKNQLYFDPDKIAAINVVKDNYAPNQKEGKIYLKSKNLKNYNFLTLKGIEKIYVKTVSGTTLFMIDNLILKDEISSYKIDSTYILNVEVLKSTEIEYLKKLKPLLTIVNIKLKTKENITKANEIRIRGTRYSLPNNLNE